MPHWLTIVKNPITKLEMERKWASWIESYLKKSNMALKFNILQASSANIELPKPRDFDEIKIEIYKQKKNYLEECVVSLKRKLNRTILYL